MISDVSADSPDLRVTNRNGAYADRLTVVFRAIDNPSSGRDIGPAVVFVVHPHGTLLDLEGLRRELEVLARGPGEIPRSYVSTLRYGHTSWGADGAAATFLLTVGGQVVGQFLADGLMRIGSAIRASIRTPETPRPITEREARFWAGVMVSARFEGVNAVELIETRLRLGESSASMELSGPDGATYRIEMELVDGLVALGEVERMLPDSRTL